MAESYPISGQYSPDHRNPYRTNEAFHFDPDEEEKLAGQLEGIITKSLLNRFFRNFVDIMSVVYFYKGVNIMILKVMEAFDSYTY